MGNSATQVKVSVIIPVFNVSQYLSRCIESVLNQDFNDFEVILVDDGSTDDSGTMCDDYASKNDIIKIIHKKNGGLSSARLAGYRAACGKYICFIDSDDYLKECYLKDLYECAVKNKAQMCICAYSYERDGKQTDHLLPIQVTCLTNIKDEYVLPIICDGYKSNKVLPNFLWLKMILRDIISDDLFVSERDVYQEDLIFNLLISDRLERISLINKPNYVYCHNGASLTKKYRSNAWTMQINLHNTIRHFCDNHGYKVEGALSKRLINAVIFTVRNAAKADYNQFLQDINHMKSDNMYAIAIKNFRFIKSSNIQMMVFLCLKFHFYSLLYIIFSK